MLSHLSNIFLLLAAITGMLGGCIALWTFEALRNGFKEFLQRALPVWLPFTGIFGLLSYRDWPIEPKIICAVSMGIPAGLFFLQATRGNSR